MAPLPFAVGRIPEHRCTGTSDGIVIEGAYLLREVSPIDSFLAFTHFRICVPTCDNDPRGYTVQYVVCGVSS